MIENIEQRVAGMYTVDKYKKTIFGVSALNNADLEGPIANITFNGCKFLWRYVCCVVRCGFRYLGNLKNKMWGPPWLKYFPVIMKIYILWKFLLFHRNYLHVNFHNLSKDMKIAINASIFKMLIFMSSTNYFIVFVLPILCWGS